VIDYSDWCTSHNVGRNKDVECNTVDPVLDQVHINIHSIKWPYSTMYSNWMPIFFVFNVLRRTVGSLQILEVLYNKQGSLETSYLLNLTVGSLGFWRSGILDFRAERLSYVTCSEDKTHYPYYYKSHYKRSKVDLEESMLWTIP